MVDLAGAVLETFSPHVGDRFTVAPSGQAPLELTLAEAEALAQEPLPSGRVPFSLVFGGPPQPILAQGIWRLEHRELGSVELFLTPIQPDASSARYQAIFS